ncbi:reverse transcriptase domain-containing protein [Tanacetum coccineum]
MKKEVENGTDNEAIRSVKEEITRDRFKELVEMPRSQPIGYYLKHEINKELIEGLIGNQRYNDFLLARCLGIDEDVLVEIAGYVYPVDFVILDVKKDKKKPFILGTPFLTTAKAKIRFDKGTITLKSGKNKINFFKILESPRRVEVEIKNDIDPVAPTNTISRLILE